MCRNPSQITSTNSLNFNLSRREFVRANFARFEDSFIQFQNILCLRRMIINWIWNEKKKWKIAIFNSYGEKGKVEKQIFFFWSFFFCFSGVREKKIFFWTTWMVSERSFWPQSQNSVKLTEFVETKPHRIKMS